jgi:hypothetical protein
MYVQTSGRRRGLRGLGADLSITNLPTVSTPSPAPTASSCSYWDFFFNAPAWQACQRQAAVAQIQSVPANAAAAGYSPDVVAAAQAAADAQIAQVPSDVAYIASTDNAGTLVTPASVPAWVWYVGIGAGALLLIAALK